MDATIECLVCCIFCIFKGIKNWLAAWTNVRTLMSDQRKPACILLSRLLCIIHPDRLTPKSYIINLLAWNSYTVSDVCFVFFSATTIPATQSLKCFPGKNLALVVGGFDILASLLLGSWGFVYTLDPTSTASNLPNPAICTVCFLATDWSWTERLWDGVKIYCNTMRGRTKRQIRHTYETACDFVTNSNLYHVWFSSNNSATILFSFLSNHPIICQWQTSTSKILNFLTHAPPQLYQTLLIQSSCLTLASIHTPLR